MTDHPETLAPYRMPWRRDQMKQLGALTPMLRYVPRNPLFLIGAAVVGGAGVLAWRNREKIATAASPMIDEARAKGQALIDDAKIKGDELIEQAKTTGEAVVAKAARVRRRATPAKPIPDLH
jgi:cell division septum initiation protein DivIVA